MNVLVLQHTVDILTRRKGNERKYNKILIRIKFRSNHSLSLSVFASFVFFFFLCVKFRFVFFLILFCPFHIFKFPVNSVSIVDLSNKLENKIKYCPCPNWTCLFFKKKMKRESRRFGVLSKISSPKDGFVCFNYSVRKVEPLYFQHRFNEE